MCCVWGGNNFSYKRYAAHWPWKPGSQRNFNKRHHKPYALPARPSGNGVTSGTAHVWGWEKGLTGAGKGNVAGKGYMAHPGYRLHVAASAADTLRPHRVGPFLLRVRTRSAQQCFIKRLYHIGPWHCNRPVVSKTDVLKKLKTIKV